MSEDHRSIIDARVCEIRNEMDEDQDENDETSRMRFSHFFEEICELVTRISVEGHYNSGACTLESCDPSLKK